MQDNNINIFPLLIVVREIYRERQRRREGKREGEK